MALQKELLPRSGVPLLEACHVDILIVKLEAAFERVQRAQAARRLAASEAAYLNLLKATEPIRDLLQYALKGDRADIATIFGGTCERIGRLKHVLAETAALSTSRARDARWQQLEAAIATVEQVLREAGKFRAWSAPARPRRGPATSDVTHDRGAARPEHLAAAGRGEPGGDEGEPDNPSGGSSDQEDLRVCIRETMRGDNALIASFFDEASDAAEAVSSTAPRAAPKARRFLASLAKERKIAGVAWYPLRLVDSSGERFFLKRYNDFRLLDRALREGAPEWFAVPDMPEPWKLTTLLDGTLADALQEYLDRLLAQVDALDDLPELELFLGPDAPDRILHEAPSQEDAPGRGRLMTLSEFIG